MDRSSYSFLINTSWPTALGSSVPVFGASLHMVPPAEHAALTRLSPFVLLATMVTLTSKTHNLTVPATLALLNGSHLKLIRAGLLVYFTFELITKRP